MSAQVLPEVERPLCQAERVGELEWLIAGGVGIADAARRAGFPTLVAAARAARTAGCPALARRVEQEIGAERVWGR